MESYTNPVFYRGNDPYVVFGGGKYYYFFSVENGVAVAEIKSPYRITEEGAAVVYRAPESGPYSHEYWAPELHFINGKWYIYVAADDGSNHNHRMYVLEAETSSPLGSFRMAGKISDPSDKWAIDGTVMLHGGELYFIWSGWEGDTNVAQNIYIAKMDSPVSVSSKRVLLSKPEYPWETVGKPLINEGPAVLKAGGRLFVAYSASGSWTDDYCLGLLTFKGPDALDAKCWEKSEVPVFSKAEGSFGPGHCSFVSSPDGKTTYIVYHANLISGTGWAGRSVRVQKVGFSEDGSPVFGVPAALGETIYAD